MKKSTRKQITAVLCLAMSLLIILSACDGAASTPDPTPQPAPPATPAPTPEPAPEPEEPKITDGWFFYQGPRTGDLPCFIRFNEDGTYFAKFFGGGVMEAGNWELVDKEMDFIADFGPDNEPGTADDVIETASQVIIFTNFATGARQEVAFDGSRLLDFSLGGMSHHNTLVHVPDYDYNPDVEEIALAVQMFFYDNDFGASLTLYHNRTFNDFTTSGESGTWVLDNGVFLLTTDTGQVYTLTVSENGRTAVYVKGSETLELSSTVSDALYTFEAAFTPEHLPVELDVFLICKPDGTAEVVVSHDMIGNVVVDTGTWVIENMVFITFELEFGGTLNGDPDFASATEQGITVEIAYAADVMLATPDFEMPLDIDVVFIGQITA